MHRSQLRSHKHACTASAFLVFAITAVIRPAAAEDTPKRIDQAVTVLDKLTDPSRHGIRPEEIGTADCVAVIPGFKKGAAVVGVSFGRGFISCRDGESWSAPAAIALAGGSLGIQLGGEAIDIVMLSLDKQRRSKLLSDRFTVGSDASAAWGNGKTAHDDPNVDILFFGRTKGAFAGFGLDGTTLKPDDSGNKSLYGRAMTNTEIVEGATTPPTAQAFVSKLASLVHPQSSTTSDARPPR